MKGYSESGERAIGAKAAVCTIVAKNYLPFARVLMSSVRRHNPDLLRIVILTDRVDGRFDPDREDFDIVLSEQLGIPHSGWFHFKYSLLELSTAVKPYALEFLFASYGLDKLIYLDPDIKIFQSLEPLLAKLDRHSILLTPHLTAPIEDELRPTELDILRSGAYNLGFLGLSWAEETQRFLKWWQQRLYDECVVDLARGLFVDQRWVDLVPGMFPNVEIVREPGYNVAYWNLSQRRIRKEQHGFSADGEPLYFFHFSGFDPDNPNDFSKHQNRHRLSSMADAGLLVMDYRDDLLRNGFRTCRNWPYAFGHFDNGFPIPDAGRSAHHECPEIVSEVAHPFSDQGFSAFLRVWNQPVVGPDGETSGVTRLAYRIYRTRADVQAVMPDVFGVHQLRFMEWVLCIGKKEHHLHEVFLAPVWDAFQAARQRNLKRQEAAAKTDSVASRRLASGALSESLWHTLREKAIEPAPESLNRLIESGRAGVRLTRLAKFIYDSRPDLQRFFPDPYGRYALRFLLWFLTYGRREYNLADEYVAPIRRQWQMIVGNVSVYSRLWCWFVLGATELALTIRPSVRKAIAAMGLLRVRALSAASRATPIPPNRESCAGPSPQPAEPTLGLNVVGYLRSEMGTGESARLSSLAAKTAGIPVYLRDVAPARGYQRTDFRAGPLTTTLEGHFSVFHVNADETPRVLRSLGQDLLSGKYNIGYWAWELEEFPNRWSSSFHYYREIWTPSTFCRDAIASVSPLPVYRVPHAIDLGPFAPRSRDDFGLPQDRVLFLVIFDMMSVFERKNPLGAITAFRQAFSNSRKAHLVVKINNSNGHREKVRLLAEAGAELPMTIIDRTIPREQVNALISICDGLVSLHRSEGFGLAIAEAMALGKPVVATAYSGNMDFTNSHNSFLVGYHLKPVGPDCEPYDRTSLWADPILPEAAAAMRQIASDADLRKKIGGKGREFVRTVFSPEAVGRQVRSRLEQILASQTVSRACPIKSGLRNRSPSRGDR